MRPQSTRRTLAMLAVVLLPALAGASPRTEERVSDSQAAARRLHAIPGSTAVALATEQGAIQALREDGARQVRALALRILATPDESSRRALTLEVCEIKRTTRMAELRARSDFAARRGDVAAARRIADQLDRMLRPRLSVAVPESRKPAGERGDRP